MLRAYNFYIIKLRLYYLYYKYRGCLKLKRLINQIFKFGMVGGLCFFIDYGLMILLTEFLGVHYLLSSSISFTVSVIVNYILSMKFVFQTRSNSSKIYEFIFFVVLSIVGLGLNQMIMWIVVDIINIHYMISKIFATFIVMIYNFASRKLLLEKKV